MDRRTFLATGAALALAPAARAATPEDAKLRAIFDRMYEDNLDDSPEAVTRLGLDKGARAGAKSKLDSASIASLDEEKARTLKHLADLKTVDRAKLSPADQPNYDAVLFTLEGDAAAGKRYGYGYQSAGQPYVLSQLTGAYQDIPDFLGSQHAIEVKSDADAYLERLSAFATVMDEEVARVRRDVAWVSSRPTSYWSGPSASYRPCAPRPPRPRRSSPSSPAGPPRRASPGTTPRRPRRSSPTTSIRLSTARSRC